MESLTNAQRIDRLKLLWISMRPQQWYKNILLFAGFFFTRDSVTGADFGRSIAGFVAFCLLSSGLYLINDVIDRAADSAHPEKSKRPIASGLLEVNTALYASFCMILTGLVISLAAAGESFTLAAFAYIFLTALYSAYFKSIALLDVFIIAAGFVIRALAGCFAIDVKPSAWLLICTFLLAMILALSKRRADNPQAQIFDPLLMITTAAALVSYSLFTFQDGFDLLLITIPFAWYGVARYMFLVYNFNFGSRPEQMFKDRQLVETMIIWLFLFALVRHVIPNINLWA